MVYSLKALLLPGSVYAYHGQMCLGVEFIEKEKIKKGIEIDPIERSI